MAASKAGELATVFSLNSDDVVFMFPRRETFGKEELAAGSKAMAGVQIDRTSEIVDLQALADWGLDANRLRITITQPGGKRLVRSGYTLTIVRKQRDATGSSPATRICWPPKVRRRCSFAKPHERRGQSTRVPSEVVQWPFCGL